jgi:hypothetical protein
MYSNWFIVEDSLGVLMRSLNNSVKLKDSAIPEDFILEMKKEQFLDQV